MRETYENLGAAINITMYGTADAMSRRVILFYNCGIIKHVPNVDAGTQFVMVQTTQKRLADGMETISFGHLFKNKALRKKFKGNKHGLAFLQFVKLFAQKRLERIEKVESYYDVRRRSQNITFFPQGKLSAERD